jgi:hypothetical protein
MLDKSDSSSLLDAIIAMPYLVPKILTKISAVDAEIEMNPVFHYDGGLDGPEAGLVSLCDIYVERASSLWKEPEVLAWFIQTAKQAIPLISSAAAIKFRTTRYKLGVPLNVQRHVFISEM